MTLVEFLLARLDEDQAAAERIETTSCEGVESAAEMDYFRFAERASSECEAKRRIVDLHSASHECSTGRSWDGPIGRRLTSGRFMSYEECPTLSALASPYADHPDYQEEWRP